MYIKRTLIAEKGTRDERVVEESDIASIGRVIILLGEPGIGKTELTVQLESTFGAKRVAAGTFYRTADPSIYQVADGSPLIIDGLDEVPTSNAEPSIDRILSSLGKLKNPNVIISCRAADWTGAVNRQKFSQDYGVTPVPVYIQPFSHEQASDFLLGYDIRIAPDQLLSAIRAQGLNDLAGNPLTLRLLAEVWLRDSGLPSTKTELLRRATELLTDEENPAHDLSPQAQIPTEKLLDVGGSIFAHLLLAGAVGIATGNRKRAPEGFVPLADLSNTSTDGDVESATKTRLFRPEAEDQLAPIHRVIAEYLAARWLSQQLDSKLSERRLLRLIEVSGGIPSALRGLHAWLGHFSPQVRERCIDADPYGFLRYGDTTHLSAQSARYLLKALTRLADDDPYFRSEDWSVRSVAGLARSELKSEIIDLITSPQRHVQLSALILTSLIGSTLTGDVIPELLGLIKDSKAPYVERSAAAEALATSNLAIDWHNLMNDLLSTGKHENSRLATETIAVVGPSRFSASIIGTAITSLNGLNDSDRREARVHGADFLLIERIDATLAQDVLDVISAKVSAKIGDRDWHPGRRLTSSVLRLLSSAIDGPQIQPARFWTWVSQFEGQRGYPEEALQHINSYLEKNDLFRRNVQRIVIYDTSVDGGPWMAIVHELPRVLPGLIITIADAIFFLDEIAQNEFLDTHQVALWGDLVRATRRPQTEDDELLKTTISLGTKRHAELADEYEQITRPPLRDYQAENLQRQRTDEKNRRALFREHRKRFATQIVEIESGKDIGALASLANAYLNRYTDLDHVADPVSRLKEWVGERIANSALKGFISVLERDDLPDLRGIWSIRDENKHWTVEPILLAGISEIVRTGGSLTNISASVVDAILGIWWDMPDFHGEKLGRDIETALENAVFQDELRAENFVRVVIETQLETKKPHIDGLYRLVTDSRFISFAPRLAIEWLQSYPEAPYEAQLKLLQFLLHRNDNYQDIVQVILHRLYNLHILDHPCQLLWKATAFCVAPDALGHEEGFPSRETIWTIKSLILPDRTEGESLRLPPERYEAIIEAFALLWPSVGYPDGAWSGDQNPWDASEFVTCCINALGSDPTSAGTEALERLSLSIAHTTYLPQLKHVAYSQRRSRRDEEYTPPTINAVAKILSNSYPSSVKDLQAVILDHLDDLQRYVTNADTGGWEAFWESDHPKIENVCRDRLLDLLRPRLPGAIELFPELPMPAHNRVDIYATILGQGLPIELKGQWHPEVWSASKTQLDEKYARDWRTGGLGIYVVLWFGKVSGKNLPRRPDGTPIPTSPSELQTMLLEALGEGERSRIDVIVFDVSKPQVSR